MKTMIALTLLNTVISGLTFISVDRHAKFSFDLTWKQLNIIRSNTDSAHATTQRLFDGICRPKWSTHNRVVNKDCWSTINN
jgi:hypothetical protein